MSATHTLGPHLPYLRRYARALTGSQTSGDAYVRASLEAFLEGNAELTKNVPPRLALYRLFHRFWAATGRQYPAEEGAHKRPAVEQRLQALQPSNREALLLTTVEGFSAGEAAQILDWGEDEVEDAISAALRAIDRDLASRILIIEDELVIAMDLEDLVVGLGHTVVGIATTRDEAVRMAARHKVDLILTDIRLADGSSGVDAVGDILSNVDVPAIFITAFPECLLTGERMEPTYLITKPFSRDTVRATIGQALFFHKPVAAQDPSAPRLSLVQ
jgi:DNA-directed RNA polymerase specialized sigma24 family protein/CheY-like chemotaxis protein